MLHKIYSMIEGDDYDDIEYDYYETYVDIPQCGNLLEKIKSNPKLQKQYNCDPYFKECADLLIKGELDEEAILRCFSILSDCIQDLQNDLMERMKKENIRLVYMDSNSDLYKI